MSGGDCEIEHDEIEAGGESASDWSRRFQSRSVRLKSSSRPPRLVSDDSDELDDGDE